MRSIARLAALLWIAACCGCATLPPPSGRTESTALRGTDDTRLGAVHAGYARWRKAVLEAGVTLYEYKPVAPTPRAGAAAGPKGAPMAGSATVRGLGGVLGSGSGGSGSSSSLHAKTFTVDHRRVVIASFNFDPRSLQLNTELGFIIDSPELARSVEEAFAANVPQTAWQVTLTEAGRLQWTGHDDGVPVRLDSEPEAGFLRRTAAAAFSVLPLDWML